MKFFFKAKKSIVGLKIPKPFERQAEGATCQHGGVVCTTTSHPCMWGEGEWGRIIPTHLPCGPFFVTSKYKPPIMSN